MLTKKVSYILLLLASCLLVVLCLFLDSTSTGETYKWRDEQGRIHLTDSEQNIPPQYREQVKEVNDGLPTHPTVKTPEKVETKKEDSAGKVEAGATCFIGDIRIPFVSQEGLAKRVIIDVNFNKKVSAPILVDTGSPGLVLSSDLAMRLGLFDQERSNLWVFIGGIGGAELALRTIVDQIEIGDITEEFVPAHIVANMPREYEGLLGMDLLSGYILTIDSANNQLIAYVNPEAENLPAGRDRFWWESTFKEFRFHKDMWEDIYERLYYERPPYEKMADSSRKELIESVNYQKGEAQSLFNKLNKYARWHSVPTHWRK